jgi:hypothetical protein
MGVVGEKGTEEVFRCVGGRCFGEKTSGVGRDMAASGDFGGEIIDRNRSPSGRLAKISFGSGCLDGALQAFRRRSEPGCGRRPTGFRVPAMFGFGRCHLGLDLKDSGDD